MHRASEHQIAGKDSLVQMVLEMAPAGQERAGSTSTATEELLRDYTNPKNWGHRLL